MHLAPTARAARASVLALLLALLAALAPSPARGAEEYGAVPVVVKVEGGQLPEARVFANAEKTLFLVLVPGDKYLYKVDRPGKAVWSLPRASALVKGNRCRPVDGASAMLLQGGLFEEVPGGFTFNALSGKKVGVLLPSR